MMEQAIAIYRDRFEPSETLDKPYVMLGLNIVAADTESSAATRVYMRSDGKVDLASAKRLGPNPDAKAWEKLRG